MAGESKVGKRGGCLQLAGKKKQLWDSIGQPTAELAKSSGKAGSRQENPSFIPVALAIVSAYEETCCPEALGPPVPLHTPVRLGTVTHHHTPHSPLPQEGP